MTNTITPATMEAPILYLSSESAGWDGLLAQAYYEPDEIDSWISPALPETALVLLGCGRMLLERRARSDQWRGVFVGAHDLMLKPGGSPPTEVRWRSLSAQPMETLHLLLSSDLLGRIALEAADHDPAGIALSGQSGFKDPLLAGIALALWRELAGGNPAGRLYADSAAQMLAVHLLRHYASPAPTIPEPSGGLSRRQIVRTTDFIQANLSQDLSLGTLAAQVGLSAYHFARLFRQTMDESPHQFVLRRRIAAAKRLLRHSDAPLAEVALSSGFASQSHLTQVFRRYLGRTPRSYRRES